MYLASMAMTVVMYIFFAHSGCSMNQAGYPRNHTIQSRNPRAGLAQAATVSIYCTYLTFSAVAMEPDDQHCNPLVRATGTQYNYAFFHVIFLLATMWIATLLTQNIGSDKEREQGDFVPVGRTYWASWVNIVSAWVCYAISERTLGAPVMMPESFDYS
jgi:hypothetical protein